LTVDYCHCACSFCPLPIAHFDLLFADLENKAKTTLVSRTNDHLKKNGIF
jgi:hypothetical protein